MSNSVALVMFLVIILLSVGGFVFMFTQTAKIPVKTITCVDEWDSSTVSYTHLTLPTIYSV